MMKMINVNELLERKHGEIRQIERLKIIRDKALDEMCDAWDSREGEDRANRLKQLEEKISEINELLATY